jgi:hypothetical protein
MAPSAIDSKDNGVDAENFCRSPKINFALPASPIRVSNFIEVCSHDASFFMEAKRPVKDAPNPAIAEPRPNLTMEDIVFPNLSPTVFAEARSFVTSLMALDARFLPLITIFTLGANFFLQILIFQFGPLRPDHIYNPHINSRLLCEAT